jgi:allantoinase
MTPERGPGMDHGHYRFQPIGARPRVRWPEGADLAAFVLLHVESFELTPPEGSIRDPRFRGEFGSYVPDYRGWSAREYGNRVGLWRVLDLLDEHGLKATVAIDAQSCERYPAIVAAINERGWETVAHGVAITRMITSRMSEDDERAVIGQSASALDAAFAARPAGWLSPDFGESTRTPALVAEAGFSYLLDWANDDAPYWMTTPRPIVSVPYQVEWDDLATFLVRRVPIERYPELIVNAFDRLRGEGRSGTRIFGLPLHPWFIGAPHRFGYLAAALKRIAATEGVWWARAGEIANAFAGQVSAEQT